MALAYYAVPWKALGYEHDIGSGTSGPCYRIDPGAIRAVAEKGGTLEDFEEYARRTDVQYEIGRFPSRDAGVRAAIKKVAVVTQDSCYARGYRIVWSAPDDGGGAQHSIEKQALFYCGAGAVSVLRYEADVSTGISGRTYFVDPSAIRAVAERDGTLDDFAEYDRGSQAQKPADPSCSGQ